MFDTNMLKRLHKRIKKLEIAPDVYGKPLRGLLVAIERTVHR
jgi:hypothetical protein